MFDQITLTSATGRGSVTLKRGDRRGYWLDDVDFGQAEGQHNAYRYYNQVGESIVSTTVLPRAVSISGYVVEHQDTLRRRCDFLNAFLSPTEDYDVVCNDRVLRVRPDCSIIYSRTYTENNGRLRRFLIQATAPDPLFSGAEDRVADFDTLHNLFRFPTGLGMAEPVVFGLTSRVYHATIDNTGGFAVGLVADIAFSGTVTNPKLHNLTTGGFVGVNRVFAAEERLRISTRPGRKAVTLISAAGEESNLIRYRDDQTTWVQLQPGENVISVSSDDPAERGSMTATVRYTPLYLEVE